MKLYLIAAFLVLVPTALAHTIWPTSIILIDGDYLMSETMDARRTFVTYFADRLRVTTKMNIPRLPGETIDIKGDFSNLKRLNRSLTIESYTGENNFSCLEESKELSSLIESCSGNILLREMTENERNVMQKWKEEQKKSNNLFEITYIQRYMGFKAFGLNNFVYEAYQRLDRFSINLITNDHDNTERSMWIQEVNLAKSTFTIRGLPTGSNENCYGDRDDGLKPVKCKGDLVFA